MCVCVIYNNKLPRSVIDVNKDKQAACRVERMLARQ